MLEMSFEQQSFRSRGPGVSSPTNENLLNSSSRIVQTHPRQNCQSKQQVTGVLKSSTRQQLATITNTVITSPHKAVLGAADNNKSTAKTTLPLASHQQANEKLCSKASNDSVDVEDGYSGSAIGMGISFSILAEKEVTEKLACPAPQPSLTKIFKSGFLLKQGKFLWSWSKRRATLQGTSDNCVLSYDHHWRSVSFDVFAQIFLYLNSRFLSVEAHRSLPAI